MIKILQDSTSRFQILGYWGRKIISRYLLIQNCAMSYYASTSTHPSGQWLDIVGSSHLDGGKFVHLARHSRANLVVKERVERHDLQNHFCYFLPAWLVSIKLQISHIFFDIERVILHPECSQFHNFNRNWKDSTSTVTRFKGLLNVSNSFSKTSWFASRNVDFRGCKTSRWLFS